MNLIERLLRMIEEGKGPQGRIYPDHLTAIEAWDRLGGHLLWLRDGDDQVFFITEGESPIDNRIKVEIVEVTLEGLFDEVEFTIHPSALGTIGLREFMEMNPAPTPRSGIETTDHYVGTEETGSRDRRSFVSFPNETAGYDGP